MRINILVFPCGSEIGLDVYSSVCSSTYFHLIGGSSIDDHGRFVYEDYIPNIPFVTEDSFIPAISKIVKERKISAIYPTMDQVITILKEHELELGCKIVSSSRETTRICLSKELTYRALQEDVRIPKIYDPTQIPPEAFPVFAKPKIGYGAKNTMILLSQDDVDSFTKGKENLLILEYLPGEEYTVDCFTNKDGKLLYSAARRRARIKDGISTNTTFVEDQSEFEAIADKINNRISFRGAWFYQVKRNKEGNLCLMEIASRLGGSSLLSRAVGVNFALLSLFDLFDYPVEIVQNNYRVELDRALGSCYKTDLVFDVVYCDYDDCLIIDKNSVNLELVKFLYKCLNQKKKIVLLSKHDGNLKEELVRFRLNQLFDEVIHIAKGVDKVDYIHDFKAIFFDDSFAERKKVKDRLHIPVFSPDMVDVLI